MKYLHDINLDQNELQNAIVHPSTSTTRPANPLVGQLTYDTDINSLMTWNGTAWVTPTAGTVTSVSGTAPIQSTGGSDPVISIDDATTSTKGAVQVGTNIDVAAGVISVKDASTTDKGIVQLTNDLGGTATAPSVENVGGKTKTEVASAVDKSHDQNTDTGTTATSFQLDSLNSGPRLKNVDGKLYVRNATDSDGADLRIKNLQVDGDLTHINSNEVHIGDNVIELNSDVNVSTSNDDGGVEVRRVLADAVGTGTITGNLLAITGSGTAFTTELSVGDALVFGAQRRRIDSITSDTALTVSEAFDPQPSGDTFSFASTANAALRFDNTSGLWKVTDGSTSDLQTHAIARKHVEVIGNGTDKSIVITHNLNTRDLTITTRETAAGYAQVIPDVKFTSLNTVTLVFKKAPTTNQYTVTLVG